MYRTELGALDQVGALVVVLKRDGRVLWWNHAFVEATGFTQERLPIAHFTELLPEEDRARLARVFQDLPQDESSAFEYPLITARGETRWMAWSSRVLYDDDPLVITTGIDRTRERLAFEKLQASEERLRAILSGSVDANVWLDDKHQITFFNAAAERLWGYSADEVIGRPLTMLMSEEQIPVAEEGLRRFAASPKPSLHVSGVEVRGLRKDGSEFSGDLVSVKTRWRGRWTFHLAMRDVTRRQRVEQEQRFFAELGHLFTSSHDRDGLLSSVARLAVRFVADCCIVDVVDGDGLSRLTCESREPEKDAVARALCEIQVERSRKNPTGRVLAQGRPFLLSSIEDGDLVRMARSEEELALLRTLAPRSLLALPLLVREELLGAVLLWSSTPGRYDDDTIRFADEVGRRVGIGLENARLYEALESALRARDDVLRIVAHDLRSPLVSIQMAAHALSRLCILDPPRKRSIDVIERASGRMGTLIEDLLDIARVEGGQLRLRRRRTDARELVEEAAQGARPLAETAGLRFEVRVPPNPVEITADRLRCVQILSNLLGNALKFTPRGGRVELVLEEEAGRALFRVLDTGPGISKEAQKHLFEPFWQRRRSTREGAGLGLAIARALVQAHQGEIGVESELGRGSTFWFRLPRDAGREQTSSEGRPAPG